MPQRSVQLATHRNCLVVVVEGGQVPSQEVEEILGVLDSGKVSRFLCVALGAASINGTERKQFADVLGRNHIVTAVLTDSNLVRGMVTAVNWLGSFQLRSFPSKESAEAMSYLGFDSSMQREVLDTVRELKARFAVARASLADS